MDTKNKIPGVSFVKRNIGTIIGLILLMIIVSISTPKFLTCRIYFYHDRCITSSV